MYHVEDNGSSNQDYAGDVELSSRIIASKAFDQIIRFSAFIGKYPHYKASLVLNITSREDAKARRDSAEVVRQNWDNVTFESRIVTTEPDAITR